MSGLYKTNLPVHADFTSSDGNGNPGPRGDCGHVNSHCNGSTLVDTVPQDWRGRKDPALKR
jgi:hypothetical protein